MDAPPLLRIPPFPLPVRAGLAAWRAATRLGWPEPSLAPDELVLAARRQTGLDDFGDESFRTALSRLVEALEGEASLHLLGRAVMRSSIVRAVACRLRQRELERRHPGIFEQRVDAPIFVTGLQRTGTTKLHRLLACAEGLRPLSAAEALNPAPIGPPVRDDPRSERLRLAQARRAERGLRYVSPALFAIHPIEADAPEEDVFLFDVTFESPAVDASLEVPSYSKWLREIDARPAYAEVRELIRLLLWQRPGRYLGKTPHHQEHLEALFAVFPDARVIQTHRDPVKVVPSFSSMMAHAGAMLSSPIDVARVGRRVLEQTVNATDRVMAARERLPDGRVLDVQYADLVRDPIGELKRIHDFAGIPWTAAAEERMRRWLVDNPQRKYGTHRYAASDFGLGEDEIRSRFAAYRRHFAVPEETA